MKIGADFSKTTGTIKPMHGVGQPPFLGSDFSLFHYLKEAGIPYSRLHDVGGALGCGLYVDIQKAGGEACAGFVDIAFDSGLDISQCNVFLRSVHDIIDYLRGVIF